MLHPIFSTLIARPDLVVDHLSAYAALVADEATSTCRDLKVRVLAWAVAGVAALVFVLLAGVAVMVGVLHDRFHWVLVLVPGAALLAMLLALLASRRPTPEQRFAELRRQVEADVGLLRPSTGAGDGRR